MTPLRLSTMFADEFRILSLRKPSSAVDEHPAAYPVFGLITACAAGMGRYWDHPHAGTLQYLGLGSVLYVPLLAGLLWFISGPLATRKLTYRKFGVFVSLTSLPALLYAIPVEQFLAAPDARAANAWFLGVVAAQRVAMLVSFLRGAGGIRGVSLAVAALHPLVFVVSALAVLNLEHAAFAFMSGTVRNTTPYDGAYHVVLILTGGACWSFVPLSVVYLWLVQRTASRRRADATVSP